MTFGEWVDKALDRGEVPVVLVRGTDLYHRTISLTDNALIAAMSSSETFRGYMAICVARKCAETIDG